jgi:hypothetical protein
MAVKHSAKIHGDITGIILRLITPDSSLSKKLAIKQPILAIA